MTDGMTVDELWDAIQAFQKFMDTPEAHRVLCDNQKVLAEAVLAMNESLSCEKESE